MPLLRYLKFRRTDASKSLHSELKLDAAKAAADGDWPKAEKLWQLEINKGKASPAAWIGLSTALRKQGRFNRAEDVVSEGLKQYPDDLGLRNEQADIAHSRSDWPEAVKRWSKIIKDFPEPEKLAAVYVRLSDAYARRSKFQQSEKIIKEALKHHPRHPAVLMAYARIAGSEKDWPLAVKRWQEVVEKLGNQSPVAAWANLAESFRQQGKITEAKKVLRDGLKNFPNDPELELVMAEAVTDTGNWASALKIWKKLLKHLNVSAPSVRIHLYVRFNVSLLERLANIKAYKNSIKAYSKRRRPAKIAVYTSVTAGYDELKLPQIIDPRIDYFVYSDDTVDGLGVYEVRPLNQPGFKGDGSRATRYPKTHPHVLFPDYEAAVWVDTSLMIVGDIMPTLDKVLASGQPVGNATHPHRESLIQEIEACIDLKKDDPAILKKQLDFYQKEDFETKDLANNGVLFFNLKHPKLAPVMETWWDQILRFSKRDQLSFNYALYKNGVDRFRLTSPPEDIRDHELFIFVPHHTDNKLLDTLNQQIRS